MKSLKANQKFKDTPAGRIPVDWVCEYLGNVVELLAGYPFSSEEYSRNMSDTRLLRGDNIIPGAIRWDNVVRWPSWKQENLDDYVLMSGDLVLAMDRTWVSNGVKIAIISKGDSPSLLVQRVLRVRPQSVEFAAFYSAHVCSYRFECYIHSQQQAGGGVPHISQRQVARYPIALPPPDEQKKIAEILSAWDYAIRLQEELIREKQERKRGLMQQLLTGKRRLAGFKGEWKTEKADQVFLRKTKKDNSDLPILSVTQDAGVIVRTESGKRIQYDETKSRGIGRVRPQPRAGLCRPFRPGNYGGHVFPRHRRGPGASGEYALSPGLGSVGPLGRGGRKEIVHHHAPNGGGEPSPGLRRVRRCPGIPFIQKTCALKGRDNPA